MRILLDESLPRKFGRELPGHSVRTVPEMGWAHKRNGELIRLAENSFDVFITIDRGLIYQQNLSNTRLAIVLLRAPSNRLQDLKPLAQQVLDRLVGIQPGQILQLSL